MVPEQIKPVLSVNVILSSAAHLTIAPMAIPQWHCNKRLWQTINIWAFEAALRWNVAVTACQDMQKDKHKCFQVVCSHCCHFVILSHFKGQNKFEVTQWVSILCHEQICHEQSVCLDYFSATSESKFRWQHAKAWKWSLSRYRLKSKCIANTVIC